MRPCTYYRILSRWAGMPQVICTAAEVSSAQLSYHIIHDTVHTLSYPLGTNCLSFLSSLLKYLLSLTLFSPWSWSCDRSRQHQETIFIYRPPSHYLLHLLHLHLHLHLHPHPQPLKRDVACSHSVCTIHQLRSSHGLAGNRQTSWCYKRPADCGITKIIHYPA